MNAALQWGPRPLITPRLRTPLHRPVSLRRPLASATAALRGPAPARVRHGAELLPELVDFEGAMQLAHALQTAPTPASALLPVDVALARAKRRLAAAEDEAREPLRALSGASFVPPERIERVLARAGVPQARRRKAIGNAARELFEPLETRTLQRIGSVRRLVGEVRRELGPVIAATGPEAARLEQLDAALGAATVARSDALLSRAVGALGDAFAADLEQAVIALPKPCPAIPVAAWTGEGGFVAEHVARCEGFVVAAFVHERARVDLLVRNTLRERLV